MEMMVVVVAAVKGSQWKWNSTKLIQTDSDSCIVGFESTHHHLYSRLRKWSFELDCTARLIECVFVWVCEEGVNNWFRHLRTVSRSWTCNETNVFYTCVRIDGNRIWHGGINLLISPERLFSYSCPASSFKRQKYHNHTLVSRAKPTYGG